MDVVNFLNGEGDYKLLLSTRGASFTSIRAILNLILPTLEGRKR